MPTMIDHVTYSQHDRVLQATTPLADDVLVPTSMEGEEGLSQLFLYTVDFTSVDRSIAAADLLGKPVTIKVRVDSGVYRPMHGIVRRFTAIGGDSFEARYRLEIVPSLWLLTLATHTRTFEDMSILDVVEQVCKEGGVTDLELKVTTSFPTVPFLVQYRETDFAFVSRLLEGAGLYYRFAHASAAHTLVITDAVAGSIPTAMVENLEINEAFTNGRPLEGVIFRSTHGHALHAKSVSVRDHHLLRTDDAGTADSKHPAAHGTLADFLGDLGPKDSTAEAKRRIEQEEVQHEVVMGASTHGGIAAGMRLNIERDLVHGHFEAHLVRLTQRAAVGDFVSGGSGTKAFYENQFTAIPAATRYRPARATPWPSVRGTQLAKIVGTGQAGDIDVDKNGCVLLEFPWDTGAGKDGKSKHRVHVASVWAGTGWGFVQHPRLGQEVLVEFLEGDPNRPIVTGRVFNSAHKPLYELPGKKTQSGWKSRTLRGGDENFNELRFDDDNGHEHVWLQAEKDLQIKVKNDETRDVLHDRTTKIKNHDTRTVEEGNDVHTVSQGNQTVTVQQGNREVTISQGNDTLKISMGNLTIGVSTGNISIKADAGKITLEAAQGIDLKVAGTSIKLTPAGIAMNGTATMKSEAPMTEIKGAMVKIEGQAMTTVKAAMTQVNGDGMLIAKGGITMIN